MTKTTVELSPDRKLAEAIAEWLMSAARTTAEGVLSLAHLLVIVPTAQAGRRLRLALARRAPHGLLPPDVRMPALLAQPSEAVRPTIATRAEEWAALWEAGGAKGPIDAAVQLAEIREILGANALTFADVAARVGTILTGDLADIEVARWQALAELEQRYEAALARRGKRDRIRVTQELLAAPERPAGIEAVVVAGVLDPLPLLWRVLERFDWPVTELVPGPCASTLRTEQVIPCGTGASEGWRIAELFASVKPTEALPALCLADAALFPEIQGALQAKGLTVHDPSATPLATSSLGHLVGQIAALKRTSSYAVFSAFVRSGDARRWLCEALGYNERQLAEALTELDRRQAQYLPEKMEEIGPKLTGAIRNIYEFIAKELRKKSVRDLLEAIFAHHILDEQDADAREFVAAAGVVNELLTECFAPDLPPAIAVEIFERRLAETTYALEPDEGDVILTDGWLELPFLETDELIIAGFQEGCVPESVVGHAFLPDALRRGLGLPDNASRAARDQRILDLALACRPAGAVRITFHGVDPQGDVCKPSRLLFAGAGEADLVTRVKRFYTLKAGTEEAPSADLPEGWRLGLEIPPAHEPLEKTSPSGIDDYLKCPFTYRLRRVFGEKSDDRAEELDPAEFGTLAHEALEAWGQGPLRDSEDAHAIAAELADHVDALLQKRFGTDVPAIVALQGESVKRRLAHFADAQVAWHRAGWRTVATERKFGVTYGHTRVSGKCDRIDYRAETDEWCVIDYKTWDSADRASSYDEKKKVWKSLQLPLYCAMLDADDDPAFAAAKRERICAVYCILGKSADNVRFGEPMSGAQLPEAEVEVRRLIDRIERGIFWPPSPKMEWQWDFQEWIFGSPEESVPEAWRLDQERRLAEAESDAETEEA